MMFVLGCAQQTSVQDKGRAPRASEEMKLPEVPEISDEKWATMSEAERFEHQVLMAQVEAAKGDRGSAANLMELIREGRMVEISSDMMAQMGNAGPYAEKEAVRLFLKVLEDHPIGAVRAEAAISLAASGDERAVPALLKALKDRDVQVQVKAAEGLIRLGEEEAAYPTLARVALKEDVEHWVIELEDGPEFLSKEEETERKKELINRHKEKTLPSWALRHLQKIDSPEKHQIFEKALKDSNTFVRYRAASALMKVGRKQEAIPALDDIVSDVSVSIEYRKVALSALASGRGEKERSIIIKWKQSDEKEIAERAAALYRKYWGE